MTSFPHAEIMTTLAVRDGGVAVPGVVLFSGRERPIFIADGDRERQARSLAFFASSPLRRAAGQALLTLNRVLGRGLPRAELVLPTGWRTHFRGALDDVALYCGSPGPLQKLTLFVPPASEGEAPVVVKVSLRATADQVIAHEAQVLGQLGRQASSVGARLPSLVAHGRLDSGRQFLATHAGLGSIAPASLQPAHLAFLRDLAAATRTDMPWVGGRAMRRTEERLSRVADALPADIGALIGEALHQVRTRLGQASVPHVLSHGDFTRFNIREQGDSFVVFDWEYAQADANPLADLLHFRLSQPGNWSALTVMHHALAQAEEFVESGACAGWRPTALEIAALALHAVVDTLVFYADAGEGLDMNSFLVQRYAGLLACVSAWQVLR
jgi:hypothetical protein